MEGVCGAGGVWERSIPSELLFVRHDIRRVVLAWRGRFLKRIVYVIILCVCTVEPARIGGGTNVPIGTDLIP